MRLQDKVPGFSGEIAMKIIEKDLGKSVSDIYDTFDPEPIAAASLGQGAAVEPGYSYFSSLMRSISYTY